MATNHKVERGRGGILREVYGTLGKGKRKGSCVTAWTPLAFHAVYVGLATVGAATWWFLYDAGGPHITFYQLVSDDLFRWWNLQLQLQLEA